MSYEVNKDWVTQAGLRAVVIMTDLGHHCGYVGIPASHPLHGVGYSSDHELLAAPADEPIGKRGIIPIFRAAMSGEAPKSPEVFFNVHGGLTYSGGSATYPAPSDGLWWFGYDCGHSGDAPSPEKEEQNIARYGFSTGGTFRDLDYNVAECEALARQLVEVAELNSASF